MDEEKLSPIYPGEISPRRINEIVHGKRNISADTALRLSRYFGLSGRFWMNLQSRYDLEMEKDRLADRLEKEVLIYYVARTSAMVSPLMLSLSLYR